MYALQKLQSIIILPTLFVVSGRRWVYNIMLLGFPIGNTSVEVIKSEDNVSICECFRWPKLNYLTRRDETVSLRIHAIENSLKLKIHFHHLTISRLVVNIFPVGLINNVDFAKTFFIYVVEYAIKNLDLSNYIMTA